MADNEVLQTAIKGFSHTTSSADIRAGRKQFFDKITCRDDNEGLRIIDTIGGEHNNMIILAGVQKNGTNGVVSFSFVRKQSHFAIQVISTIAEFIPSEQVVIGFKFASGKEVLSGFVFPPVNVEGSHFWANYAQISADDLAVFIGDDLVAWQMKNKINNASLESDFTILATDILPQSEAKYLLRSMAAAMADDYLKSVPTEEL